MTTAVELLNRADAVLSDLDGTLVDSTEAIERAWTAYATRHRLDPEMVIDFAPERCVVPEDAPAGILAGRTAGARVIALRTTHDDDALGGADAIVEDVAAIL